jgi:hypothetical protein
LLRLRRLLGADGADLLPDPRRFAAEAGRDDVRESADELSPALALRSHLRTDEVHVLALSPIDKMSDVLIIPSIMLR